jgi:hypothetical protein
MFPRVSFAMLVLIGCVAAQQQPAPVVPSDPLEIHRLEWKRSRPHSYAFTYRDQCFCAGSFLWVRIIVAADTVVQADLLPAQDPGVRKSSEFRRPTVDSLFAWIADAYTRKSERVDVLYDPKYHFPSHADMDWRKNIMDDEFSFDVQDFTPITWNSDRR